MLLLCPHQDNSPGRSFAIASNWWWESKHRTTPLSGVRPDGYLKIKSQQHSKLHRLFPKCLRPLHLILHMLLEMKVIWKTYIPGMVAKCAGYLRCCLHKLKIAADNTIQHFCPVLKNQKWQARWEKIKKVQLDFTFYFIRKTKSKSYIQILGTIQTLNHHHNLRALPTWIWHGHRLKLPLHKGASTKAARLKGLLICCPVKLWIS